MKQSQQTAILWLLFFTTFLEMLGLSLAIPIFAPMVLNGVHPLSISIDPVLREIVYGLMIASYPLAQFFGTPVLGALSDRHGRKPLLILSKIGTLLSYIITAYAIIIGNLYLLIAARLLDGFTGGNISVAQSAIADFSDKKDKSKNFGIIGMAFGLGFIFGPALGGILSDSSIVSWFSFETPFLVAAIITVLNILFVWLKLPETLTHRSNKTINPLGGVVKIIDAFRQRGLRTILIVYFLYVLGFNFFTQFFQVFLVTDFDFSQRDIGMLFTYVGVWIAIAQGYTNRVASKHFNPSQILTVSLLMLGFTLPLLVVPTNAMYLYVILPFVANFSGLSMPNSIALVSDAAPATKQGEILGTGQSLQALGTGIPPIIAGVLSTVNSKLPIVTAGILILIAWLLFITKARKGNI